MTETVTVNTEDIISVTKRLSEIIRQEIAMIEGMKLAQLHTIYDEKIKLCSVLEGYKDVLANNPHIIKSMSRQTLDEMRKAVAGFEALLMEALKTALNNRVMASAGYNRSGAVDYGKKKMFQLPPVSISESI